MGRRVGFSLENRVRAVRQARGWSQAQLARACGLSRQALSAVEAGRYVPNTAVAVRLAQALGCPVEELFAPAEPPALAAVLAQPAPPPGRVRVGRVRDRLVAWPLRGFDAALPADGTVAGYGGRRVRVVPLAGAPRPDRVLFVAGCDPALRLAGALVERRGDVRVHWVPLGSARALQAARDGLVHAAGTHLHFPEDREGVLAVRRWFGSTPAVAVTVSRWVEGVMVRPGARVRRPEDLLRPGVSVVNREVGSGTRAVFDRWLQEAGVPPERVPGYHRELASHLAAAEALSAGLADAAPGVLPVARSYGLDFLPVAEQRYELVVPQDCLDTAPVRALLDAVASRAFRQELAAIGGYDPSPAGTTRVLR